MFTVTRLPIFQIMPRSQNAHAIVNAGFLYKFSESSNKISECRLAYGGLSSHFTRATATEALLRGRNLFCNETLQAAIKSLKHELVATENPPEPSAKFRKQLAINLFYKVREIILTFLLLFSVDIFLYFYFKLYVSIFLNTVNQNLKFFNHFK